MVSTGEKVVWERGSRSGVLCAIVGNARWNGRERFPHAGGNERERSNEQERIENGWFTSRGVGGSVTARQDHWMTPKTRATVHGKTLDVEHASNRSRETV
jgi:hypothetical protein